MHYMQDCPGDTVRSDEVTEKSTDVAELVGLVAVDGLVVVAESFLEGFGPDAVELAEALTDEAVEGGVGAFL